MQILPLFIGFIAKIHSYDFVKSSYHVNKIEQVLTGTSFFHWFGLWISTGCDNIVKNTVAMAMATMQCGHQ